MRRVFIAFIAVLAAVAALPAAASDGADQSKNVKRVAFFPYENKEKDFFSGGTDIDFSGKYIYAMQQGPNGGIHILDGSGKKPKKVGFFPCPGGQNDVAVVKPGLLAIGYHESTCNSPGGAGVQLVDVRNPKKPKLLGALNDLPGGTHTLTTYPGKPIIYASPGGLANSGGTEQIIDVSNPSKPKVAGTFTPQPAGCHDVGFYFSGKEKLAVCAGAGEAQVWDVSDPLAPQTIGHVAVPAAQLPHSVAFSDDGRTMVIGDEAVAGNDCVGGPTGSLWIYDFTIRQAPVLVGHFGPPRGPLPAGSSFYNRNTWCSAHLFNFIPGTHTLVGSWYAGGMNVIDLSNPSMPKEIAHYMGTDEITNYWSAYWYDGRIYANDRVRGLDVFTVKGLKEGK